MSQLHLSFTDDYTPTHPLRTLESRCRKPWSKWTMPVCGKMKSRKRSKRAEDHQVRQPAEERVGANKAC